MGYNLIIGNVIAGALTCEDGQYAVRLDVEHIETDAAPSDGTPTDGTNERWPSYSAWADFCKAVGLYEVFFCKENGLLREHPGVFKLEQTHLLEVRAAGERLSKRSAQDNELHRGRLAWLEFWIDHALQNCPSPGIKNT